MDKDKKPDIWAIVSWLGPAILSAIWLYIQLQVWKQEGKDHMLTAANMVVTIALWLCLAGSIYRAHLRNREISNLMDGALVVAQETKAAGRQATLLFHLADCAIDLKSRLELAEFSWRKAGDILVYPLDLSKNSYKEWGHHINEQRDFMCVYTQHRVRLSVDLPGFNSRMLEHGYPSDCEYPIFLSDLQDHINTLERLGKRVWESEDVMESLYAKKD